MRLPYKLVSTDDAGQIYEETRRLWPLPARRLSASSNRFHRFPSLCFPLLKLPCKRQPRVDREQSLIVSIIMQARSMSMVPTSLDLR